MLVYKMNILEELKKAGWSGYQLQKVKEESTGKYPMGSSQVNKLRKGKVLGSATLDTICRLLNAQPGDVLEYIPDDRYVALKKSGYFEEKGIPTPPLEDE